VVQREWVGELEKDKDQALRNDLFEHEKRNPGLEAESKNIEERNMKLEEEQVIQGQWIDELKEEKEEARRNDLQRESDLLKERNQRLEAESKVIKERDMWLEAEQVAQSKRIDELEKEKEQAQRNVLLEREQWGLESDLLKERNQRLEAKSKVIENRNLRLEAELVVKSNCIYNLEKEIEQALKNDVLHEKRGLASFLLMERNQELEKEKKQARRDDLQRESDLPKERNQRLEVEISADSHLNHTLKVCTCTRFLCSAEEVFLPQQPQCACFSYPSQNLIAEAKSVLEIPSMLMRWAILGAP
jgi:hypothetical protein